MISGNRCESFFHTSQLQFLGLPFFNSDAAQLHSRPIYTYLNVGYRDPNFDFLYIICNIFANLKSTSQAYLEATVDEVHSFPPAFQDSINLVRGCAWFYFGARSFFLPQGRSGCCFHGYNRHVLPFVREPLWAIPTEAFRFGEALHPGPELITIGTVNPTQIFMKEECFPKLSNNSHAIWACSETSHTTVSRSIATQRFRRLGFNSVWSTDNEPLDVNRGVLRGRAAGTCILSSIPMRASHHHLMQDVKLLRRYSEAVIQLTPNTTLLIISLYGPANGRSLVNPDAVLHTLAAVAFERAASFQGPAIIAGDLNVNLDEVPHWQSMESRGWKDLHVESALKWDHPLEATCKNQRHSFLLGNAFVVPALHQCRVKETFDFAMHPTLFAEFHLPFFNQCIPFWSLPKSTDGLLFDEDLLTERANLKFEATATDIQDALRSRDTEAAFRHFVNAFEFVYSGAVVNSIGEQVKFPRACLGRIKSLPFVKKPLSPPVCRNGRSGDIQPLELQVSVELRRLLKQVRRLQSLKFQILALQRNSTIQSQQQCQELWDAILAAKGFAGGFPRWIVDFCGFFVPLNLPHLEYVDALFDEVYQHYKTVSNRFFLEKRRNRRRSIVLDIQRGGAQMFKEIRGPLDPPLDTIATMVTEPILRQRWPKEGKDTIICANPEHSLCLNEPLTFQGQTVDIAEISGSKIHLQETVRLRTTDFTVTQCQRTSDPTRMHKLAADAWGTRWNRDSPEDEWPDLPNFMTCLADCPSLPYEDFQKEKWLPIIRSIPKRSARGSCAFTKTELLVMPASMMDSLFDLLRAFENGLHWPMRWAIARITCLRKGEDPSSPLQMRPITIMSRIYRCWSNYRSKQVLAHLAKLLPPQVAGTTGKVSADMLAALTLVEVQVGQTAHNPRFGAVLDLQKCYDSIPQKPMLQILSAVGIPSQYITGLSMIFADLRKTFDFQGTTGPLMHSSTGLVQGCSLSVTCMCALTLIASANLKHLTEVIPIFFADNWSVIAKNVPDLKIALEILEKFANCLKMTFSVPKSWLWTSQPKLTKTITEISLQGTVIPVKARAVDLGCDISYHAVCSRTQLKKRVAKAKTRLKTIQKKRLPFKFRRTAAKLSGQGAAMYATELVYITPAIWHQMRKATAEAINLSKGGSSSYISVAAMDPTLDPQFRGALRRVKFWRKFLGMFPCHRDWFLEKIASNANKKYSVAASFRNSFFDIGWTCQPNGILQHTTGLKFSWIHASGSFIRKMLIKSWGHFMMKQIQHRKFVDMLDCDLAIQTKVFDSLCSQQQGLFLTYCSGKHITGDFLSKFAGGDELCPFCQQVDSRWHRIHECVELHDLRQPFLPTIRWLVRQPTATTHFGLCPNNLDFLIKRMRTNNGHLVCNIPEPDDFIPHVFTDGSACHQEHWEYTFAAGAFVSFPAQHVYIQSEQFGLALPGHDHSSFRGESYAILLALNRFWKPNLYSDCQAVVSLLQRMLAARNLGCIHFTCNHWDIWGLVWAHILARPPDTVHITKVPAHCDFKQMDPNSHSHWLAFCNDAVDQVAKKTCKDAFRPLLGQAEKQIEQRKQIIEHLRNLALFVCQIAEKFFALSKAESVPVVELVQQDFSDLIPGGVIEQLDCSLPEDVITACPFSPRFAQAVVQWACALRWPSHDAPVEPISLLELYVDWCLFSDLTAPILVPVEGLSKPQYKFRDESVVADTTLQTMSVQSHTWTRMMRWFVPKIPALQHIRFQQCRSLRRMGYCLWHLGLSSRPELTHSTLAFEMLARYFHTSHGKRRNLSGVFTMTI